MLQRIQTLWTFLAVVCAALSFKFPFFSGTRVGTTPANSSPYLTAAGTTWILLITSLIIIGGFFSIISYKSRRKQAWVTIGLILLSLLNIVLFYMETKKFMNGSGTFSLTSILVLAIPVFLIMAFRGIVKDEKLVKSTDRLR